MIDLSIKNGGYQTFNIDIGDKLYYFTSYGLPPPERFGYKLIILEALENKKMNKFFKSNWKIIYSNEQYPSVGMVGDLQKLVGGKYIDQYINEFNLRNKFCASEKECILKLFNKFG